MINISRYTGTNSIDHICTVFYYIPKFISVRNSVITVCITHTRRIVQESHCMNFEKEKKTG